MNRLKKDVRKYREAREGLGDLEIEQLDESEAVEREFNDLTSSIHLERFLEAYASWGDSRGLKSIGIV